MLQEAKQILMLQRCECELHGSYEEGFNLLQRMKRTACLQAPAPSFREIQWEEEQGESSAQSAQTAQQHPSEQGTGTGKLLVYPELTIAMLALCPEQHPSGRMWSPGSPSFSMVQWTVRESSSVAGLMLMMIPSEE